MPNFAKNNKCCNGNIIFVNDSDFKLFHCRQQKMVKMGQIKFYNRCIIIIFALLFDSFLVVLSQQTADVTLPTKCETCKYVVAELEAKFSETGKKHDVIQTQKGHVRKYHDSELRFVETMEELCERILSYDVHKEFEDSRRFGKEKSQTMKTIRGLVDKGVKVDLGIPEELWDSPSVEVTHMKQQCEHLIEQFEDDLEQWYFSIERQPLTKFLCIDRYLKDSDTKCLDENVDSPKMEL